MLEGLNRSSMRAAGERCSENSKHLVAIQSAYEFLREVPSFTHGQAYFE